MTNRVVQAALIPTLALALSQQIKRRMPQSGDLLQPEGSASRHRAMAQALQHDQTALSTQLSADGAADIRALGSPPTR